MEFPQRNTASRTKATNCCFGQRGCELASILICIQQHAGCVLTLWHCKWIHDLWLLNHATAYHLHGDIASNNSTVFNDSDPLDIASKQTFADTGGLSTVTAEVFVLTTLLNAVASDWGCVSIESNQLGTFDAFVLLEGTNICLRSCCGEPAIHFKRSAGTEKTGAQTHEVSS